MNHSANAAAIAASNAVGACLTYLQELGETDPKARALVERAAKLLDWHDCETIAEGFALPGSIE